MQGKSLTRQGISLLPVTCRPIGLAYFPMGGLTLLSASLRRRRERAISSTSHETGKRVGVWSLRILKTSEASGGSLSGRSPRSR
jgi:hypothetical protein